MSTIATVKTRLAAIQGTITGVKRTYAEAPVSLPYSDLPCFVTFAGPSVHNWAILGEGEDLEERTYFMRLYVRPVGQGLDGEAEQACEPFFERVRDCFASHPGLGLGTKTNGPLAEVQRAWLQGDNGVGVLPYAGEQFIGIEWRLQVRQIVPVTYAAYE